MQMDVVALNLFGPVVKSVIQSAWPLFIARISLPPRVFMCLARRSSYETRASIPNRSVRK